MYTKIARAVAAASLAAVLVGALPALGQVPALGPCERIHERLEPVPVNVELATVTDTTFTVTWLTCAGGEPFPTRSLVGYGEVDGPVRWRAEKGPTAYHNVRIGRLKPGTRYVYRVVAGQVEAPPDRLNPGAFTTLTPPPGKELFRFAALADVHIDEEVSGLATSQPTEFPPGYRSDRPYPEVMAAAAVGDLNSQGVRFTILPADGTSHGELHSMKRLHRLLTRLDGRYLIARGSHDRPNQDEKKLAESECPPDGDCFREVFRSGVRPSAQPRHLPAARVYRGYTFIALDSVNLDTGRGEITGEQLVWLEQRLEAAARAKRPTIIFFHHPVAEYSTTAAVPPAVFGVDQQDAQRFLELIGRYDVRMVVNAHTHRNWIAYSPHTGRMPILELGPTKEYPGGYSIFRVFEGGIVREWHPIDCGFCNRWRETTRGEYFALYPFYTSGSLRERSFVHRFDTPDVPGVPSLPFGLWPPVLPGDA